GAAVREAGADHPAAGDRADARRRAARGSRGRVAAQGRLGDGGGDRRARQRRRALPLGVLSREALSVLPDRLAEPGQSRARARRLPQLRGRVLAPRAAREGAVDRAGARRPRRVRPDRGPRRADEAGADDPDRLRALRSRVGEGARDRARSPRRPRHPGRRPLRPLRVQLDGRRAPRRARGSAKARLISIAIPVYNEAASVREAALDLCRRLDALGWDYELILSENGSRDGTRAIIEQLAREDPRIRFLHGDEPNY